MTFLIGSTEYDNIAASWDRDSRSVFLQAGATYKFSVNGYNPINGFLDPVIYLSDSNRQQLLYNYTGPTGSSHNPQLTFTAQSTGKYFVDVGAYWNGIQNVGFDYSITAVELSPPPMVVSYPQLGVTTTPLIDNSQVDNSTDSSFTLTDSSTTSIDNSTDNSVTQTFNITINGDSNSLGDFGNTAFDDAGTAGNDIIEGNFYMPANDLFRGGDGDDELTGYRGADLLVGDAGDDILRGGNGKDVLTGGTGGDTMYGGFGQNTFTGERDGAIDKLWLKSDHLATNWLTNSANNQDGTKVDIIGTLDTFDRIYIQGAYNGQLSYGATTANIQGQEVSGLGIYAGSVLEAIYTGNNVTSSQLDLMTTGVPI